MPSNPGASNKPGAALFLPVGTMKHIRTSRRARTAASIEIDESGDRDGPAIRVATYNIHVGIGRDGHFMPHRIAEVINELDADIIALQEVAFGAPGFHMLDYLHQACRMTPIAAPTLITSSGNFGNAILTRFAPIAVRRLDLSVPRREPRGALDIDVDCNGQPLRFVATHLGLRPAERRHQIERLLHAMRSAQHTPTVLIGDLNEWFLWGRPLRWLHRHFKRTPALATFPSGRPFIALDRVWAKPRRILSRVAVHASALAQVASDHLPLVAMIDFGALPRPGHSSVAGARSKA